LSSKAYLFRQVVCNPWKSSIERWPSATLPIHTKCKQFPITALKAPIIVRRQAKCSFPLCATQLSHCAIAIAMGCECSTSKAGLVLRTPWCPGVLPSWRPWLALTFCLAASTLAYHRCHAIHQISRVPGEPFACLEGFRRIPEGSASDCLKIRQAAPLRLVQDTLRPTLSGGHGVSTYFVVYLIELALTCSLERG